MVDIYDLHCHILPEIDDGCRSVEESISVLQQGAAHGICGMVATPHYYPKETVANFLQRRESAYQMLQQDRRTQDAALPVICLGAEVAYHPGLVYEEQLGALCFGHSRYLLLELPFSRWSRNVLRDVQAIKRTRGITPIIAHLERYLRMQDNHAIESLMDADALIQMNAGYLLRFRTRHQAKKLLKQDLVQMIASDCHNLTSRPLNLPLAFDYLEKCSMQPIADEVNQLAKNIFEESMTI